VSVVKLDVGIWPASKSGDVVRFARCNNPDPVSCPHAKKNMDRVECGHEETGKKTVYCGREGDILLK